MLLFIGIVVVVGIVIFFILKATATQSGLTSASDRVAPRGPAWETTTENGILNLIPSKSVSLSLVGNKDGVHEVERFLSKSATVHFPERALKLAILMSRHNVECPEVEQWRKKIVSTVHGAAKKEVAKRRDVVALAQGDSDLTDDVLNDLMFDAVDRAYEELSERPSYFRSLDELEVVRPEKLNSDDAFLELASHDPERIQQYFHIEGRAGKVVFVDEDQRLQEWIELVSSGLATRGPEISAAALVAAYKLADINAAVQAAKPIRRKADAVAFLTPEVVARLPNINRAFMYKPLDQKLAQGMRDFGWIYCHACLLLETLRCAEHVKVQLEHGIGKDDAWHIEGECCKPSRSASERESTRRLPAKLPPFHVGCQAKLNIEMRQQ